MVHNLVAIEYHLEICVRHVAPQKRPILACINQFGRMENTQTKYMYNKNKIFTQFSASLHQRAILGMT